jgi:hypothetical protein
VLILIVLWNLQTLRRTLDHSRSFFHPRLHQHTTHVEHTLNTHTQTHTHTHTYTHRHRHTHTHTHTHAHTRTHTHTHTHTHTLTHRYGSDTNRKLGPGPWARYREALREAADRYATSLEYPFLSQSLCLSALIAEAHQPWPNDTLLTLSSLNLFVYPHSLLKHISRGPMTRCLPFPLSISLSIRTHC